MEHLIEGIETLFNLWSERNKCLKDLRKAKQVADGHRVKIDASQNKIQTIQDEVNAWEAYLWEAPEKLAGTRNGVGRETTQVNREGTKL